MNTSTQWGDLAFSFVPVSGPSPKITQVGLWPLPNHGCWSERDYLYGVHMSQLSKQHNE